MFCRWYLLCDNEAIGTAPHPVLGDVPICQRCADKHEIGDLGRLLSPAEEIVAATEVVEALVGDGTVRISYVTTGEVVAKYGSETVSEVLRLCLRLGSRIARETGR